MRFKAWLEDERMSTATAAALLGINRQSVWKLATGRHFPRHSELREKIKKLTRGRVLVTDLQEAYEEFHRKVAKR